MEDTPRNKMVGNKDFKQEDSLHVKSAPMQTFFFPTLGVNIEAATLEEAQEKLKELQDSK